jgi:hypothetical protein
VTEYAAQIALLAVAVAAFAIVVDKLLTDRAFAAIGRVLDFDVSPARGVGPRPALGAVSQRHHASADVAGERLEVADAPLTNERANAGAMHAGVTLSGGRETRRQNDKGPR